METQGKILGSVVWKGLESGGSAFIQFVIQILLSRLLSPEDFGISSITSMFIFLLHNLLQNGFTKYLVQKKEVDDLDYSTTFLASIVVSAGVGLVVFLTAPLFGNFYQSDQLSTMLRIICILAIVGSYSAIQTALVQRQLLFKQQFIASTTSVLLSGRVAIYLAFHGFGVWSIIAHQILTVILTSILLAYLVRWTPSLRFSKERLMSLKAFAWPLFVTNIWEWLFLNLRPLIIGRIYSTEALGYYNRANQFPTISMNIMGTAMQSVMLPVFAQRQDQLRVIHRLSGKLFKLTSFVFFPIMVGMALVSRSLIILLLTEKWLMAVPIMQILCIASIFSGFNTLQLEVLYSIGQVKLLMKYQYVRMFFGLIIIGLTFNYGIFIFVIGGIIENIISVAINCHLLKNAIDYSILDQVKDMLSSLPSTLVMALVVAAVPMVFEGSMIMLILLQILGGALVYLITSIITNKPALRIAKALIF